MLWTGDGQNFLNQSEQSHLFHIVMSTCFLRPKERVSFCICSFTESLLGRGLALPGLYWLFCSKINTILPSLIYIFFGQVRKWGHPKKKLSSEVGESQSFCAGSLSSIFRVDYDLWSPYTAGLCWFKAWCDLHVPR